MEDMWIEFTDFELAMLAEKYGVDYTVTWDEKLQLVDRPAVEYALTVAEFNYVEAEKYDNVQRNH